MQIRKHPRGVFMVCERSTQAFSQFALAGVFLSPSAYLKAGAPLGIPSHHQLLHFLLHLLPSLYLLFQEELSLECQGANADVSQKTHPLLESSLISLGDGGGRFRLLRAS